MMRRDALEELSGEWRRRTGTFQRQGKRRWLGRSKPVRWSWIGLWWPTQTRVSRCGRASRSPAARSGSWPASSTRGRSRTPAGLEGRGSPAGISQARGSSRLRVAKGCHRGGAYLVPGGSGPSSNGGRQVAREAGAGPIPKSLPGQRGGRLRARWRPPPPCPPHTPGLSGSRVLPLRGSMGDVACPSGEHVLPLRIAERLSLRRRHGHRPD